MALPIRRLLAHSALLLSACFGLPATAADPVAEPPASAPAPAASQPVDPACPPAPVEPTAEEVRQAMAQARDHGLLWKLKRDGRTSWLYGTVHVAQRDWMFPGPAVMAALRGSQELALELDLLDPLIIERLTALTRQPADGPLLPAALAERLGKAEQQACLGGALQGLRPEIRVATLTALVLRSEGLDPSWGVDNFLASMAHGMGKKVHSLESPERQIKLLLGDDAAARATIVGEGLDELAQGQAQRTLRRLVNAWAASDYATLASYPQWCDCLNSAEQRQAMRKLLDERNVAMAAAIARLHQRARGVFVAVGSLHMIGPHGLPALLKARGYEVEWVSFTAPPGPGAESASSGRAAHSK
ncbi:TraB/GumN family protein [Ideonella azotifigens]|uniref:TraB/GumN family protein n=1 Tax=Ideonella azotifigens TaxID=513160 RepID=A0ABP3VMR1_9BURK|nr:TraB/GumN family protein [Ideonella azotifigens]MCD2338869.1 TraB/GumN family protein [Ideonella azotifigens]